MERVPPTANVWIEFDPLGPSAFTLDGQDVLQDVDAVGVVLESGKPPVVTVRLAPGVTKISGDAHVQIVGNQADPQMIVQFLEGLDPSIVEAAALQNSGFGAGSPIELALEFMIAIAKGEA